MHLPVDERRQLAGLRRVSEGVDASGLYASIPEVAVGVVAADDRVGRRGEAKGHEAQKEQEQPAALERPLRGVMGDQREGGAAEQRGHEVGQGTEPQAPGALIDADVAGEADHSAGGQRRERCRAAGEVGRRGRLLHPAS